MCMGSLVLKTIIIYGTECDDKTAWIPWLKEQLTSAGEGYSNCLIPNLPTPENQNFKSWSKILNNTKIDEDDIIVAWSTGAIFIVRYLYENKLKVKKLILISGFNNYIGNVPVVDNINKSFFIKDLSVAKNISKKIICIKSDKDPFITQDALNDFADKLEATIINIKNGGHFNLNAGYDKFPQLLDIILNK